MKIISWNVNGIRACGKKGFLQLIEREDPDILCIQETKAHPDQVDDALKSPYFRQSYWSTATTRKGYSGVATYVKKAALDVHHGIGIKKFDSEGRFVVTQHKDFLLFNVYFPNGSSREERHLYKQEFLARFTSHLKKQIDQGKSVIVLGDYNVAYLDIDVFDPKGLSTVSGFLPIEREWFKQFLKTGFVDTFRHFHPQDENRYTWWSYRENARVGNRGWRIDHICVTENLREKLRAAEIYDDVSGSDHCPVMLELESCS